MTPKQTINGQTLVTRMRTFVARYVHFAPVPTANQDLVVAMWALCTWISERFPVAAYLHFSASGPGCGKTVGLEVLQEVTRTPEFASTVRALAMVRWIGQTMMMGTWLQDEAEKLSKPTANDERSIFTTGYKHGGKHGITVGSKRVVFDTFCWKAFASIGDLINVLRDRCIVVYLEKGKPTGNLMIERLTGLATEEAAQIKADIDRVMGSLFPTLEIPTFLDGRDAEIWSPIFSLAKALELDAATMAQLTSAAVDLSAAKKAPPRKFYDEKAEEAEHDRTYGEMLLRDMIRASMASHNGRIDRMPTDLMIEALRGLDDAPWRHYRGVGVNSHNVAALVSRVTGPTTRMSWKGSIKLGYSKAQLEKVDAHNKAMAAFYAGKMEGGK